MREHKLKSEGHIHTEIDGSIYWITFDNPSRMNALNKAMWATLPGIFAQAESDKSVRVVVMRGAGDTAFSAGADISEFGTARTGEAAKAYDQLNHAAFDAVMNCAKPTIAMVHGYCMGGGLELALCCDLRYAAQSATFAIPAARLGIGYNSRWIRPLISALSASHAKEILFTGRQFSDQEALAMGMISRLCPADTLEQETRALAAMIADNAPLSLIAAKRSIDEFLRAPENPDLDALDKLVEACFVSEDYAEGRAAFAEKRKPVFRGK
jgi:enoyl-CoA hydratase/carnithine racemase